MSGDLCGRRKEVVSVSGTRMIRGSEPRVPAGMVASATHGVVRRQGAVRAAAAAQPTPEQLAKRVEVRASVGLPAHASDGELAAALQSPPAGTPFHATVTHQVISNGRAAGVISADRAGEFHRQCQQDVREVEKSCAAMAQMSASPAVRAAAAALEAEPRFRGDRPSVVLARFAAANQQVVAAEAPARAPRAVAAASGSRSSHLSRDEVTGKLLYAGCPTTPGTDGAPKVFTYDGWTSVREYEASGGTPELAMEAHQHAMFLMNNAPGGRTAEMWRAG